MMVISLGLRIDGLRITVSVIILVVIIIFTAHAL